VKDAIAYQRDLAIQEELDARRAIEDAGCDVVELTSAEHAAFAAAVRPIYGEAGPQYGGLFELAKM